MSANHANIVGAFGAYCDHVSVRTGKPLTRKERVLLVAFAYWAEDYLRPGEQGAMYRDCGCGACRDAMAFLSHQHRRAQR